MAKTVVQYDDLLYLADLEQGKLNCYKDNNSLLLEFIAKKLIEVNMNLQILIRLKKNE